MSRRELNHRGLGRRFRAAMEFQRPDHHAADTAKPAPHSEEPQTSLYSKIAPIAGKPPSRPSFPRHPAPPEAA